MKPYEMMSESELQEAVARYLVYHYPDVMFHSDFGAGIKLTKNQAARQKRQNGGRSKWPDMFIAQGRVFHEEYEGYGGTKTEDGHIEFGCSNCDGEVWISLGLFLELKKEGTHLKKKNGDWATEHIAEQAKALEKLRKRGYCAEFAVGFAEAKKIIDEHLGGK